MKTCLTCGKPIPGNPPGKRGPKPKYCGHKCRHKIGVGRRSEYYTLTPQEELDVIKFLESGWAPKIVKENLSLTEYHFRKACKNQGYKPTGEYVAFDHHKFDQITNESAYWLGFILADGYIKQNPKQNGLAFTLASKDRSHLEKLKSFLSSNNKISNSGNGGVCISFISDYLVDKLSEYNIVPQKSDIASPPEILKNNRHFWRGVVDGDGSLLKHNGYTVISLAGTIDVVQSFIDFVKLNGVETKANPAKLKHSRCTYQVVMYGRFGVQVARLLYQDANIFLDRKMEIASTWLK